MFRLFPALLALAILAHALPSPAQTGDGSIRGYVKDEQGAVLPGVTVTAHSPALLSPVAAVSATPAAITGCSTCRPARTP